MPVVVGINGDNIRWTHDPGIAVVDLESANLASYEAERATRRKNLGRELLFGDFSNPKKSFLRYLESQGLRIENIEAFAFAANSNPYGFNLPEYRHFLGEFLGLGDSYSFHNCMRELLEDKAPAIPKGLFGKPAYMVKHHSCHSAYSFFTSPYEDALVFSYDGGGFDSMTQICNGVGENLIHFRNLRNHCFGYLYKAVTDKILDYLDGNPPSYGMEGSVMALAAHGESIFLEAIQTYLEDPCSFGGYDISEGTMNIFTDPFLFEPTANSFEKARRFQFAANFSASWQAMFEIAVISLLQALAAERPFKNLCIGGGCGLNGVANHKIRNKFGNVWIAPATSDKGIALGSALYVAYQILGKKRVDHGNVAYLGKEYASNEQTFAPFPELKATRMEGTDLYVYVAKELAKGKFVGWHQGRGESGPRALGNRSILCDPRDVGNKTILNDRIKHRAAYRPFAPSILREKAGMYFEDEDLPEPYMLTIRKVKEKAWECFPAAIHVDGTARLHTVSSENPRFYRLISEFERITGAPVLLNTSFNDSGQPIVETVEDALRAFQIMDLDLLVVGDFLIQKGKP